MDARIGQLNSGKFYAFVNGYNAPETIGTLEEVEVALGLRTAAVVATKPAQTALVEFKVHVQKRYPAWDEVGGYDVTVFARTKADANKIVRNEERRECTHLGCGPVYYTATAA